MKRALLFFAGLICALLLAGCGNDDENNIPETPETETPGVYTLKPSASLPDDSSLSKTLVGKWQYGWMEGYKGEINTSTYDCIPHSWTFTDNGTGKITAGDMTNTFNWQIKDGYLTMVGIGTESVYAIHSLSKTKFIFTSETAHKDDPDEIVVSLFYR